MPTDSNGVYSLPDGYLAIQGDTIQPSQHNPPLEDIAAALTGRLPRNGAAPMTGELKGVSGTVAAPGYAFAAASNSGLYLKPDGRLGLTSQGVDAGGFIPVGAGMDWWLPAAPTGWVFAYGQECTSAYPVLRAAWIAAGNPYGSANGNPLFPDKRGRGSSGKDDMGGTSANRLTNQPGGLNGDTLGAAGGLENHTLTAAQSAVLTYSSVVHEVPHTHGMKSRQDYDTSGPGSENAVDGQTGNPIRQTDPASTGITVTTTANAGGGAHNNVQPTIICNYIIYAGA